MSEDLDPQVIIDAIEQNQTDIASLVSDMDALHDDVLNNRCGKDEAQRRGRHYHHQLRMKSAAARFLSDEADKLAAEMPSEDNNEE